ncbi:MAG: DUF1629 domain-containing protein [Pseudomonadota bacterium]
MDDSSIWISDWRFNHPGFSFARFRKTEKGWKQIIPDSEWEREVVLNVNERIFFHRPVDPTHVPENAYHTSTGEAFRENDFFDMDSMPVLCGKARKVLEEFDLGENQLFNVNMHDRPEQPLKDNPYAILNVLEAKDCLVPEQSTLRKIGRTEKWHCWPPELPNLVVRESAAEGVDLWYDPIFPRNVFFSGRLARRLISEGFTGINLFPLKTI